MPIERPFWLSLLPFKRKSSWIGNLLKNYFYLLPFKFNEYDLYDTFFCSFFGRIENATISFWNYLTFNSECIKGGFLSKSNGRFSNCPKNVPKTILNYYFQYMAIKIYWFWIIYCKLRITIFSKFSSKMKTILLMLNV